VLAGVEPPLSWKGRGEGVRVEVALG